MFEKSVIKFILENSHLFEWTLQGFGMLRLYLPGDIRLHVWSKAHQVKNVSLIHTHPWDFQSRVIVGEIQDIVYEHCDEESAGAVFFNQKLIRPGTGLIDLSEAAKVYLKIKSSIGYTENTNYHSLNLRFPVIHSSHPSDGCVTIVKRDRGNRKDEAYVYWPEGEDWVSGEPRLATKTEVYEITQNSLARYF